MTFVSFAPKITQKSPHFGDLFVHVLFLFTFEKPEGINRPPRG